jgi:hypothetical protein
MIKLPELTQAPLLHRGRNMRAGYQRGWGLQFSDLADQIRADRLFRDALATGGDRSVVSEHNRMNIFLLLRFGFEGLAPGHIIEFGSYRGGSALFMAKVCKELFPETKVYALDTFEGMPETDANRDAHRKGDFADTNYDEISRLIDKYKLGDNLVLVKGLFEDTAPGILPSIGSIRLNHVDCDIYSAVKYSYECSIPYMVPGGYWVFDDALYSSCIGAMEAVEEVLIQRDRRFAEQVYPHLVYRALDPAV